MAVRAARPLLCLVTDRRRLAARLGRPGEAPACLVELVKAAAEAGVDLVHLREHDLPARELLQLASACVRAAEGSPTRIVVNDRTDVALAAGAAGVHLRGDSIASARVRGATPAGFLIGRSVHGVEEASAEAARGAADYLILGTVFPSPSKPSGQPTTGPSGLRRAVRAAALPVLAIGGVTAATIPEVARSGAQGFAAIGWFIEAFADAGPADRLAVRVKAVRRLFDTPGSIP
jgi:thiamine-phosphate diphosphorylase